MSSATDLDQLRRRHIEHAAASTCAECGHVGATPYGAIVYPSAWIGGRPAQTALPHHEDRYRCDACAYSWPIPALPDLDRDSDRDSDSDRHSDRDRDSLSGAVQAAGPRGRPQ